jgi:hypothetical protein
LKDDEYPCYGDCNNTNGNYTCTCPSGTEGNAYIKDGCHKKDGFTLAVKIVIGMFFIVAIHDSFLTKRLIIGACLERRLVIPNS